MANEYLLKKWRLWFRLIDVKRTGKVSREDEEQEEGAYVKLAHLEGERKQKFIETSHKVWDQFLFHGKAGPISEDEFIEMTNNDFKSDKKKFEDKVRQACIDEFKIVDQSDEGLLSEDDFVNVFKGFGKDEAWIKKLFKAYNPVDGKITQDVYVDVFVQFLVDEDETKPDPVAEVLMSDPGDSA